MTTTASPVATDELLLLVCGPSNRLPGMFSACGITVVLPESGREAAAKESVSRHIGVPLAALQRVDLSTIIPGARNAQQARANAEAARLPQLSGATLTAIGELYDRRIKDQVESRW